jgi:hypothetical protein
VSIRVGTGTPCSSGVLVVVGSYDWGSSSYVLTGYTPRVFHTRVAQLGVRLTRIVRRLAGVDLPARLLDADVVRVTLDGRVRVELGRRRVDRHGDVAGSGGGRGGDGRDRPLDVVLGERACSRTTRRRTRPSLERPAPTN